VSADLFVRISPDVVFSAAVFTPVQLPQPSRRADNRAVSDAAAPEIEPRQADLWADDAEHAPA